jgi:hypothetical protein
MVYVLISNHGDESCIISVHRTPEGARAAAVKIVERWPGLARPRLDLGEDYWLHQNKVDSVEVEKREVVD